MQKNSSIYREDIVTDVSGVICKDFLLNDVLVSLRIIKCYLVLEIDTLTISRNVSASYLYMAFT